ncbi:MAG TPA: VOC family protein [Solirubrobacteraceae bacterium]|jgi:glyoxalase family protein|nr:VOC family protein [Solirubrobacteraceae bacterium]
MKLEGIHHITAITGDAQRNVDFYAGVLGLRLVKKTVNQDDTSVYHLFYADERGDPGSDITFFEFPGAARGRAGAGMVHRIVWRVASPEALDFWSERLRAAGYESDREGDSLHFEDFEGLAHELLVVESGDEPLIANHPEIPAELALQGFHAVRAYAEDPHFSRHLLEDALGFRRLAGNSWEARGARRGGLYVYDPPPAEGGHQGAGTVHHVAWASIPEEHDAWRMHLVDAGAEATPVIDRFYFRSIYFREPSGVLFEIATIGPGFAIDEPLEHLGEKLSLPPAFEHLRDQVEPTLTPIRNPRESWTRQ